MGRQIRTQTCVGCTRPFAARQLVEGKIRSLYDRRFCLECSPYDSRPLAAAPRSHAALPTSRCAARPVAGRDEWVFRSLQAIITLLSPSGASLIARTGVAVFSVSLLLPMFISSLLAPPKAPHVILAGATDVEIVAFEPALADWSLAPYDMPPLPDPIARPVSLAVPTPKPTSPPRVAAVHIPITAVPAAPSGSVVVASWYGPGFYENRLPCWPWLKAQGLPIQFLPDTWGVAHKSLPCGTMVTLTHGANTVTVPVVDRGPYIAGRELDLSPRVKAALGCSDLCTLVMQFR
ncbi:MAG TPA: septal ring lytic transglycosylase RlpA family protein [Candidatus Limnocylindria bacterium]|nr:septal ring lytic transglycosylase RlpA family protein [Candidatus Limnocylindria bacterium]